MMTDWTFAPYSEELKKAGVLLALEELHPPATGARVSFKGGKPTVADGPKAHSDHPARHRIFAARPHLKIHRYSDHRGG